MKQKNILIVSHVTEIYGSVQALTSYCQKRFSSLTVVLHPFPDSKVESSQCLTFVNGKSLSSTNVKAWKRKELLTYFQQFFLTLYFGIRSRRRFELCICADDLNALCGIILRKLGIINRIVYYVVDYTPLRFPSAKVNRLYHLLDLFCVRNSDYVWNVSERIASLRERQGLCKEKNLLVPNGVQLDGIDEPSIRNPNERLLVVVTHLSKSKGVDLLIEAMAELSNLAPYVTLEIIGGGPYQSNLMHQVKRAKLEKCVKFTGPMSHKNVMKHMVNCDVGIATYTEDDPTGQTYFSDPIKPKEYLACGLPVVITKLPWISKEISRKPMGIVIDYDRKQLVNAVLKLFTDHSFYKKCQQNARNYAASLDWNSIFDNAFSHCE